MWDGVPLWARSLFRRDRHWDEGNLGEGGRGLLAVAPTTPRPKVQGFMRGKGSPCNPQGGPYPLESENY